MIGPVVFFLWLVFRRAQNSVDRNTCLKDCCNEKKYDFCAF